MSNGYIILANSNFEHRQAAACAYSIKIHNPTADVSLLTNNLDVNKIYEEPFDNIIELPYDKDNEIRRVNDWQLYWATPYKNTIAVDCKTIVKESHENTWDYLVEHYDICFPKKVVNYKGENEYHDDRYGFLKNYNVSTVYSNMFFFRKDTDLALNHFKLMDPYSRDWRIVFNKFLEKHHTPDHYDPNLMHSIVINHLDSYFDSIPLHDNILHFVDMHFADKTIFNKDVEKYTEYLNLWTSDNGKLKIQNFAVNNSVSYKLPEFLTDEIYNGQRDHYRIIRK